MVHDTRSSAYRWLIVAGLFVFLAINFADKALIGLAAGPIMRELHLSHAQFGRYAGYFYLPFSLSSLCVGFLADRVGVRWLLPGMALIWSLAQVPLLFCATSATLLFSRVALGASEGPAYPVAVHALYKWFADHERALPSAVLTVGSAFGMGLIAPFITAVITVYGWRAAFGALALAGVAWSVLWLLAGREGPLQARLVQSVQPEQAHTACAKPLAAGAPALPARVPLHALLLARTSVGSVLTSFAAYVLLTLSIIWLPSYLEHVAGYSGMETGRIVALPAFGLMVSSPLLGWCSQALMARGVSPRQARGLLGSCAVVVSGMALIALPMLAAGPLLIAVVVVAFSVASFSFVSGVLLAGEIVPDAQRGRVLGINVCISTLAGFVTPTAMGLIIDHAATPFAGYRTGMTAAGMFALAASLVGAYLVDPVGDRRRFAARAAAHRPGYRLRDDAVPTSSAVPVEPDR